MISPVVLPEVIILHRSLQFLMPADGEGFCSNLHPAWPLGRRCLCCSKLSLCCVSLGTEQLFVLLTDKASANSHVTHTHAHTQTHRHTARGVSNDVTLPLDHNLTNRVTYSATADARISLSLINTGPRHNSSHTYHSHFQNEAATTASESIKRALLSMLSVILCD